MREEVQAFQTDLSDLKVAESSYNTYRRLHETEIPVLEAGLKNHNERQQELMGQLERVGYITLDRK